MLQDATIHVYLPASNLARARAFYERVLGLTPKEEYAGGVFYECGGGLAFLYPTPNAGTSKASQAFWAVEDVPTEVAELKKRGVVFEEYDSPGLKTVDGMLPDKTAAWFKDSEGNIMAIIRRR